jgi:signal transduction histidine kinase
VFISNSTKNLIFSSKCIDPQLGELNADERKLKQILLNLLSNAVKFKPEGGRITVGARLVEEMR